MKRFYRNVEIAEDGATFVIQLDGKPVTTPARKTLTAPNRSVAEAVAGEWRAQDGRVEPAAMPHTRMLTVITDQDDGARQSLIDNLLSYARSDLLCYRADAPEVLAHRQAEMWDPHLDWLDRRYGVRLNVTTGIVPVRQPDRAVDTLGEVIAAYDDHQLTVLAQLTHLTGSIVLALALAEGAVDSEAAWRAATVDETFQAEAWGIDEEAETRRRAMRRELEEALAFLRLL